MKRFFLLLVLGLPACAPSAPPPVPPEVVVATDAVAKAETNPEPKEPAVPGPVAAKPVAVALPVAKALAPSVSPMPEVKLKGPKSRDSEIARGELPLAKPAPAAVPLPPVPRKTTYPSPPVEGVPFRIGDGAELDWRGTKLPESPTVKAPPRPQPTAADVPRLGYPQPDRIPTDDPTADLSTARIVNTLLVAPTLAAPFLRLALPDPFELAEQLKPQPAPEFATVPVLVPPARP